MRLPLAISDTSGAIRAAPFRAALSALALAAGLLAIILLFSALEALRSRAAALEVEFGSDSFALLASTNAPPWPADLPETLRRAFSRRAVVSAARTIPSPAGFPDLPCLSVDAFWPDARSLVFLSSSRPSPLDSPRDVFTSADRAEAMGWREGQVLSFSGSPFRLLALHRGPRDAPLCFPPGIAAPAPREDDPRPSLSPSLLWFRALPPDSADSVRADLLPLLPQLAVRDPAWILPDEILAPVRRWQRLLSVFAGAAAALALLLGGASLSALLLSNAEKRIPEMGLRRALGARPLDILLLFLREALALVALSLAAAILLALPLLALLPDSFPLALRISPAVVLPPALLAAGLALLASIPPALMALRISPARALRSD